MRVARCWGVKSKPGELSEKKPGEIFFSQSGGQQDFFVTKNPDSPLLF